MIGHSLDPDATCLRKHRFLRSLVLLLALAVVGAVALMACGDDEGSTATPTPTPGPPDLIDLYSGSVRNQELGVVIIDGEAYTVSLSDEGLLAGFKPGQAWHLAGPKGVVVLSGRILGEFGQWERGVDFVQLDDGRIVAYVVDIDGNWSVHLGEDECLWNVYWANRYPLFSPQPGDAPDIGGGFRRVAEFCEQELGLAAE